MHVNRSLDLCRELETLFLALECDATEPGRNGDRSTGFAGAFITSRNFGGAVVGQSIFQNDVLLGYMPWGRDAFIAWKGINTRNGY